MARMSIQRAGDLMCQLCPKDIVATPDFSLFGQFNLFGSLDRIPLITVILLVFTLLLSDFFDTVGTVTAIGLTAGFD
jgi:AGZA family xanthine/uracil permease-like MFS transporter